MHDQEQIGFANLGANWLYDKLTCMDRKQDAIITAIGSLMLSNNDQLKLAAAASELTKHSDALKAAIASASTSAK